MHPLSAVLSDIYLAAESSAVDQFPYRIFDLVQRLIPCDGGTLGLVHVSDSHDIHQILSESYVFGRDRGLLQDLAEVWASDPIAEALSQGLAAPIACETRRYYRKLGLTSIEWFVQKHELHQLLLFGDACVTDVPRRWLALYRGSNAAFTLDNCDAMSALWPHLTRAIRTNLKHFLESCGFKKNPQARALINATACIEIADPQFIALFKEEWPGKTQLVVPMTVLAQLRGHGSYRGRVITMTGHLQDKFVFCTAHHTSPAEKLGALERQVALQFVSGSTYRQIAAGLGTSPNTVRNQISQIYRKLDVHSKLALARILRQR